MMKKIIKYLVSKTGYRIENIVKDLPVKVDEIKRFEPYERLFLGHTLYVHDHASFGLGENELFCGDQMYRFVSDNDTPYIIDCGANIGMSIIYFKSIYPNAKITAFEADPYIYSFLDKNIKSFGFSNVAIVNKAVWNSSNEILPFLSEGGAGGRVQARSDAHKFVEVETFRLKDLLGKKVDFLKIDIEGAEYKVIEDCADDLGEVANLFIEYHGFEGEPQNLHLILDIVQKAGFRYHVKEAFTSNEPFLERRINFGMDQQLNIFCFR